ncbi:hypothetical protein GCM10025794_26810 [Massilia kyonggiensis]|jgi:hypothetical protein
MRNQLIFKANIKRRIRNRGECLASLARDILRPTMVIPKRILNLYQVK